jgi:hypothetical protein
VPALAGVDVEARVRELLDRHRPELEQLVDVELDRALDAIVVERIAARNGHRAHVGDDVVKLCSRCGAEPRLPGRTIGIRCKGRRDTARQRERRAELAAALADKEPPRPDA